MAQYIYNITTQLTHQIHDSWVKWMVEKHIPEIMATGCFIKYQFVRLLEVDESESVTYATQFYVENIENYKAYIELHADTLRKSAYDLWGNHFVGFRSLMQIVH